MNNILAQLNSVPMYAICGGIIAFVAQLPRIVGTTYCVSFFILLSMGPSERNLPLNAQTSGHTAHARCVPVGNMSLL